MFHNQHDLFMPDNIHPTPILAFTADYSDSSSRLEQAAKASHGLEFSPDPLRPDLLPGSVLPLLRRDIPVRFHTRYFGWEMGHADRHEAAKALDVHQETIKRIHGLGEPVVTVHTGLGPAVPIRESHIRDNLSRLGEFAGKKGITVSLENLRLGHGSDPYKILKWAKASGAMITMDTGHARGCSMVRDNLITPADMVDLFGSRLYEVHVYGREDHLGHHPIKDIAPLQEMLTRLLQTDCKWWTIELQDLHQATSSRSILERFLGRSVTGTSLDYAPGKPAEQDPEHYERL